MSPRFAPMSPPRRAVSFPLHLSSEQTSLVPSVPPSPYRLLRYSGSHLSMPCCVLASRTRAQISNHRVDRSIFPPKGCNRKPNLTRELRTHWLSCRPCSLKRSCTGSAGSISHARLGRYDDDFTRVQTIGHAVQFNGSGRNI